MDPPPLPMVLEEKLARSDVVVVGRVKRLVFVDATSRDLRDLTEDPKVHLYASPEAEVEVTEILRNTKKQSLPRLIRYLVPNTATSAAEKRLKYEGKELIFLGEARELPRGGRLVWQIAFPGGRVVADVDPEPIDSLLQIRELLKQRPK